MKSYITCAILLLVQLASADRVININNQTDKALAFANKLITQRGLGVTHLPPLIYDDIELHKGFFIGVNSLERTKDAIVIVNDDASNVTVDLHIGMSLYDLVFGQIKINDEEMTGVYRVKNNSIHISYTMFNQTRCHVRLNNYEYETLTEASFESSLHNYGGDVSDVFENIVLPRINEKLDAKKEIVQHALQTAICRRRFHNLHDATHLSQIISHVFMDI